MSKKQELMKMKETEVSVFSSMDRFEEAQKMCEMLSQSSLVPENYRKNMPNTMIALEMANRIGVSPFMVMQNLDIIKGKPSWSSTFIIAILNSCGRFSPLRFVFSGEKKTPEYGCSAVSTDLKGNELVGPKVTWRMVKEEGWYDKTGSKWKTMPELMFQYRSASFFGRLYAPDILKGMHTAEEVVDSEAFKNINQVKDKKVTIKGKDGKPLEDMP